MNKDYNQLLLRRCTDSDLNQICDLQTVVIDGLKDKELLRNNSRIMFEHCIQNPNLTLGLFDDLELIALAILVDESGREEDLSKNLIAHQVDVSANLKLIMVKEAYRGQKLQKSLMWILEKIAAQRGYTHLCTTVSSKNIYSLNNITDSGYTYDHSATKYGGLSRAIYVKNINESISTHHKTITNKIDENKNTKEQKAFFQNSFTRNQCFKGEVTLASTGDLMEYESISTGKTYYGLYINDTAPMIYLPEVDRSKMIHFSNCIDQLRLKAIWINTVPMEF